jgi:hypothetical protein
VTGAGSGIGQAIALSLAGEGVRLIATDLRQEKVEATATAATTRGTEALCLQLDVTDCGQAQAVMQHVLQRFGRIESTKPLFRPVAPAARLCLQPRLARSADGAPRTQPWPAAAASRQADGVARSRQAAAHG